MEVKWYKLRNENFSNGCIDHQLYYKDYCIENRHKEPLIILTKEERQLIGKHFACFGLYRNIEKQFFGYA